MTTLRGKWSSDINGSTCDIYWAALGATRMAVDPELAYGPAIRSVAGVALNVAVFTNTAIADMGNGASMRCEL